MSYRSASGDPWSNPSGNTSVVDTQPGCIGACVTESTDWAAPINATSGAQIACLTGGNQSSSLFNASGLAVINRSGRTQLRLRLAANPTTTHNLWIGNGATATLRVEHLP